MKTISQKEFDNILWNELEFLDSRKHSKGYIEDQTKNKKRELLEIYDISFF